MSPMLGREPAVVSRVKPSGHSIRYPLCAEWACDDFDYDWETIDRSDEDYPAVRREHDIVCYHEPNTDWRQRLQAERDRLSGGDPLWFGKPEVKP